MPFVALLIELAATYILNRLQQPNGPRVTDLSAGLGDYGVVKPVLFGENVRMTGVVIAQADIKETVHKHKPALDYLFGIAGALLPPKKTYTYSDTLALLVADRTNDIPIEDAVKLYAAGKLLFNRTESAVVSETFDADGNLIKRRYGKNKYLKSLTVYGGGFEQTSDPVLDAAIGAQPGYRGTAYIVLEDLQLKDFGNAVPVPIEVLVQVKTGETMATVAERICLAANVDNIHDMSSSQLTDKVIRGYAVTSEGSCWDALKPLLGAFAMDCAEVAGQLRFYRRSQSLRATIPADEMGAYVYGDNPPDKFTFSRTPDMKLPKKTSLTFIDPARDYQPNAASTPEWSEGDAASNIDASLPLVLTADEGATAADLMQWDAVLGRSKLTTTLTDTFIGTDVGRAYAVPIADQYVPYRFTRKTRGANGIIEIEAVSDEQVTYSASVAGTSGTPIDPGTTTIADTRVVPIDGAILEDTDDEYGFYVAMGGPDGWVQGEVQISTDGIDYSTVVVSSDSAIIGDVAEALPAGPTTGLDDTLDTTSVLTVELIDDTRVLSSATDAELDNYANFAWLGDDGAGEYLQFKTATFISGSTWELTNLRRGRKGSDWAMGGHVDVEQFVLLTDGGVTRLSATTTDNWGVPLSIRGVTQNQDEADADVIAFTNTGEGKRPYSPVNVEGSWDGSNNLTITWDGRSRLNAGGLGIDDQDNYEVEIITGAGRTITATGVETVDYSAADQTSDGIDPGDSITGRVRQLSDVNDGRWRDFFLSGPGATLLHEEDDTTPLHLEDGLTPFELG